MRLVKLTAPLRYRERIVQTAFSVGVDSVSVHTVTNHTIKGEEQKYVFDIAVSTPLAKKFIDKLLLEDYFDGSEISLHIRQPRTLISEKDTREVTYPLSEPATDLYEELWQFSHVTYGLIGRVFVSACLLAYGMIESNVLLIIGGLLFLPVLPMVMAIGYGITGRQIRLSAQGLIAFISATVILFLGGVIVAALSTPPIRFNDIGSLGVGMLISLGVGMAAQLAAIDDAGRRELIGLAAASQLGLIPVWFGMVTVLGPPDSSAVAIRALSFGANLMVLLLAIIITQYATAVIGSIGKLQK